MRFFTLHERPADHGSEVIAVASGFSWFAALVPLVWFLWHRLWLGLIAYAVIGSLLGLLLELGGIAEPAGMVIGVAGSYLIGAMAADYRRWTYARHGWATRGVVLAESAWDAEQRYMLARGRGSPAVPPGAGAVPLSGPPRPMTSSGGGDAFPRLV